MRNITKKIDELEQTIKDINNKSDFATKHHYVTKDTLKTDALIICNTLSRLSPTETARERGRMMTILAQIERMSK